MFESNAIDLVPTWAHEEPTRVGYREIDRRLRSLANEKARLDVEEAKWLREADRQRVWRKVGYSTALEYLEDIFGYAPRTAMDKLRVAKELGELRDLEAAVRDGVLPWSAAKELTRVMTPHNQAAWLDRARGKTVGDIQQLVSGRKKGDDPDAPRDPELMTRRLVIELPPRVDALLEKTRLVLATERGEHVDDVALIEAVCMRALEPAPNTDNKAPRPMHRVVTYRCEDCDRAWREGRGRLVEVPRSDLELARCDAELAAAPAPAEVADMPEAAAEVAEVADVPEAAAEVAEVADVPEAGAEVADVPEARAEVANADEAGAEVADTPAPTEQAAAAAVAVPDKTTSSRVRTKRRPPATLSIPKATRDFVWARDQGRCRVPGCRATRNLACHHLEFQSHGGDHDPANLILLCDGHHKLLHDGLLVILGRAPDHLTFTRNGKRLVDGRAAPELERDGQRCNEQPVAAHAFGRHTRREPVKRPRFDDVVKLEHAKQALMQLGFKARAAKAAAETACAHVGTDADIATIVKAALQLDTRPDASSAATKESDAKRALRQLGYPAAVAAAAVDSATAHVGTTAELATLIKEALRRCGGC